MPDNANYQDNWPPVDWSKSETTPTAAFSAAGFAFGNGDVAVDGEIGEALDLPAGLGPFDFE